MSSDYEAKLILAWRDYFSRMNPVDKQDILDAVLEHRGCSYITCFNIDGIETESILSSSQLTEMLI